VTCNAGLLVFQMPDLRLITMFAYLQKCDPRSNAYYVRDRKLPEGVLNRVEMPIGSRVRTCSEGLLDNGRRE
jgi:hypothetical protein